MGERVSLFKSIGDRILSVFTNDKLNIENMYFLISEQVSINQIKSIGDVKEIYPNIAFEQINEFIAIEGEDYYVTSYLVKNKSEKLAISYIRDEVIGQIRYVVDDGAEDKINVLTYNKVSKKVKNGINETIDKFIIEIDRLSLEDNCNMVVNLENDVKDSCSVTTFIEVANVLEQKELYGELK